jgi:hypothetical protein
MAMPVKQLFASVVNNKGEGRQFIHEVFSFVDELPAVYKFLSIPGAPFDNIVIERLKALERADRQMKDKVKATLEQVYRQQSEDFVSIPHQIEGIKAQLIENAKKRMRTSEADPLYAMLEVEAEELLERQGELEAKKNKLGLVDSPEEIEKLHRLLGNFEAVWPTFDLDQRQRAFRLLINRIAAESVSPHWTRLSIDWLDAISPLATSGTIEALARQDMELHTGSGAGDAGVEGSTQQG